MGRPTTYEDTRVDTKVRLRTDHARLLKEETDRGGLSRNRLIERALDQFFGLNGPRLQHAQADPTMVRPGVEPEVEPRTRPRIQRTSQAMRRT